MKTDNSAAQSTTIPLIGSIAPWIISIVSSYRLWNYSDLNHPQPLGVNKIRHRAKAIMDKMGMEIIQERKKILIQEEASGTKTGGKDILTLLIRASVHDKEGGMSDEAILARQSCFQLSSRVRLDGLTLSFPEIPTFLIAGHETTSAAITWSLFGLSANLEAQRKLRQELIVLNKESPTMDDLKSCKYLDMVVRESLRLWSPVPSSKRLALKDVLLPLRDGKFVKLNKGDEVRIPIHPMNTSKDIWGEDAIEFKYATFVVFRIRKVIVLLFF